MHRGARIGLGQDQGAGRTGLRHVGRGQILQRARLGGLVLARQNAHAGPFDRVQQIDAVPHFAAVLAIAEEDEVIVGHPTQEVTGFLARRVTDRHWPGFHLAHQLHHAIAHLRPVVDAGTHIIQRMLDGILDAAQIADLGLAIQLDVHQ